VYVSITTLGLEQSRVSEFVAFYQRLLPFLRDVKGWQDLYLLVDHEAGEGRVLAMWETEADAYAFESSGQFRAVISQLQNVAGGPADRQVYDVVFRARPMDAGNVNA